MAPSIKHDGSIKEGSRVKKQNNNTDYDDDEFTFSTDYDSSAAEDSYLSHYDSPECALLAYARTNKLDKLRNLIQAKRARQINLDLNFKGRQKQNFSWSALHLASYFGNVDIARELLKYFNAEIDVNIQNNLGDTPLHKATLTQREDMVQLLLEYNADIFIRNSDGLTAKQLTQHNRIVDLIDAAEQADYNRRKLALLDAIINNNLEYVKKCISIYDCNTQCGATTIAGDIGPATLDASSSNSNYNDVPTGNQSSEANLDLRFITDDRGNTPLHLAALRGHKAMCVLLLEKGLEPRVKNHRGQTAIDVATFQIRQLLLNVKPSDTQIIRIAKQHSVRRYEGQLMKKVRFLGWKPIYAVLENGVFLIFNNRNDSMNKSRRGYKYLESATCEADPVNVGVFSICFSDRSKVLLLIPSNTITATSSYLANDTDQCSKSVIITSTSTTTNTTTNQSPNRNVKLVELARQKWTDAINDHIRYSTEFIKKGLRLNEDDDDDYDGGVGGLSNLNQLLPVDTITSIFQEARAHQSILERHATSLTSLIESLPTLNAIVLQGRTNGNANDNQSQKALDFSTRRNSSSSQYSQERPLSSGIFSRMASSYRSGRSQTIAEVPDGHKSPADNVPPESSGFNDGGLNQQSLAASEFLQDTWPSVLFHLKLLIESSQHTKATLSQALSLMEHQEHIRQQRIQDQEERCRVLEDSLHMLARDHHELEKSISTTSVLYNTAMARTVSISTVNTDLNEYFDAFEDFDDEKTVTPSSMPSDDEIDFDDMPNNFLGSNKTKQKCNIKTINETIMRERSPANMKLVSDETHSVKVNSDDDDEDTRSDCSALTVENNNELASELGVEIIKDFNGVTVVDGMITNETIKNR